jgi:hypothetical protein
MGVLFLVMGCRPLVLDPLGGDASTSSGGSDGLAIRRADVVENVHSSMGYGDLGVLSSAPDDSLVLFFADEGMTCSAPLLSTNAACSMHQLALAIPRELVHPGTIDLRDARIPSYFGVESSDCSGGAGNRTGYVGTLDIVDIASDAVTVELSTPANSDVPSLDGHHVLSICGAPLVEAPPTPGVAILGSAVPAGALPGPIDPNALYVFAGTASSTCADPAPSVACSGQFRAVFTLTADQIAPGDLDLVDLDATYAYSREAWCDPRDPVNGQLGQGQVSITSADASQISFRIDGSYVDQTGFAADGLYTATRCP